MPSFWPAARPLAVACWLDCGGCGSDNDFNPERLACHAGRIAGPGADEALALENCCNCGIDGRSAAANSSGGHSKESQQRCRYERSCKLRADRVLEGWSAHGTHASVGRGWTAAD